jgi:hypothetical protein
MACANLRLGGLPHTARSARLLVARDTAMQLCSDVCHRCAETCQLVEGASEA